MKNPVVGRRNATGGEKKGPPAVEEETGDLGSGGPRKLNTWRQASVKLNLTDQRGENTNRFRKERGKSYTGGPAGDRNGEKRAK